MVAATAAQADARSTSGRVRTFTLEASYTEPPDTPDGAGCNGMGLDRPMPTVATDTCRLALNGKSLFTGGIEGRETYNLDVWPDARGGLGYEGPVTFDATVLGCGKGTFQMQVSEGFLDYTSFDPATRGVKGHNFWWVLPATATGELAGRLLGGSGETNWTHHPLSTSSDFGVGTFSGILICATRS